MSRYILAQLWLCNNDSFKLWNALGHRQLIRQKRSKKRRAWYICSLSDMKLDTVFFIIINNTTYDNAVQILRSQKWVDLLEHLLLKLISNSKNSLKVFYKFLKWINIWIKKIGVVTSFSCLTTHCKSTGFTLVQNICTPNTWLTLIFKMLPDEKIPKQLNNTS